MGSLLCPVTVTQILATARTLAGNTGVTTTASGRTTAGARTRIAAIVATRTSRGTAGAGAKVAIATIAATGARGTAVVATARAARRPVVVVAGRVAGVIRTVINARCRVGILVAILAKNLVGVRSAIVTAIGTRLALAKAYLGIVIGGVTTERTAGTGTAIVIAGTTARSVVTKGTL
jgi:hypothetical protein